MLVQHTFTLLADSNSINIYLNDYWQARGFCLARNQAGELFGTRGSYFANFTSFDSTKLISSIVVRCSHNGEVNTSLLVDLSGQMLTSWNKLDLVLEQILCHRGFTGLPVSGRLRQYRKSCRCFNVLWVLTLGLASQVMPDEWTLMLDDLNPDQSAPVIRILSPGEV